MIKLFDSHAHLNSKRFSEDREEVIKRALESGIEFIVNASDSYKSCLESVELAEKYPQIYAAVGVHPHEAKNFDEKTESLLKELAPKEKVVAIGEIGLDYYYDNSKRDIQREVFRKQIRIANEVDLPIIVHNRDAHEDTLKILKEEKKEELEGVLHCFSGSPELAEEFIKLNFYISLAGPVTFKNARKAVEVAKKVPKERLLIETDCPYLTPEPKRGRRNEPAYVRYTAEKIASIRGETLEEVAHYTTENAKRLFRITL